MVTRDAQSGCLEGLGAQRQPASLAGYLLVVAEVDRFNEVEAALRNQPPQNKPPCPWLNRASVRMASAWSNTSTGAG